MIVSQINLSELIFNFKVAALWSANDDEIDSNYFVCSFSKHANMEIEKVVSDFVALLNEEQLESLSNDADQFGHWLALEMQGHGAGFFDSELPHVAAISDLLESSNFYRFESVYINDYNKVDLELFKCGKHA